MHRNRLHGLCRRTALRRGGKLAGLAYRIQGERRGSTPGISVESVPRLFDGHVFDRAVGAVARIVHQNVDPDLPGMDGLGTYLGRLLVRDVEREDGNTLCLHGRHLRDAPCRNLDDEAPFPELSRRRLADP